MLTEEQCETIPKLFDILRESLIFDSNHRDVIFLRRLNEMGDNHKEWIHNGKMESNTEHKHHNQTQINSTQIELHLSKNDLLLYKL